MQKLVIILLLFNCALHCAAQHNQPLIYQLQNDTAAAYTIEPTYTQLLEDPESKWTINQVTQSPLADSFHANETKEKGINYRIDTHWLRFTIHNNLDHAITLYFNNGFGSYSSSIEYFNLYIKQDNGKWLEERTGALVPWSKRSDTKLLQTLPLSLTPHQQQIVYLRFHDSFYNFRPDYIDIHFQTALPFYKGAYKDWVEGFQFRNNFTRALLIGIFISTVLFTLYNYLLIREKAYLYYLLFLFLYLVIRFTPFYFILIPEYPVISSWWARHILWIIAHGFLILFVREYLNTRMIAPVWDKLLLMAAWLMGIYLAAFWLTSPMQSFKVHLILATGLVVTYEIVIATIALTLIILYRKHNSSATFLLITLAPFLLLYSVIEFIFSVLRNIVSLLLNNQLVVSSLTSKFWIYAEYFTILWLVVFFSSALTRRYTQARKALADEALERERLQKEKEREKSQLISQQKVELEKQVELRTAQLNHSLQELKATQAQLVQSEKLASLGELTAGIAHEIQNPLNFVNNFSETNAELIREAEAEFKAGNRDEAFSILEDIKENERKIVHHGKRADSIVKGMLQHSRSSTGVKEPTDINVLADEYLRLTYQSMRTKEKSFTATIQSHFGDSIENVHIVSQDIGRVLLNLFSNAFYAVNEKKKQHAGENYEPTVTVSTIKINGKIEIVIKDNGNGIPKKNIDKIFQPFFTTKPTGEGTGLGLSLSYDIVKALGGELKVKSNENEGTEFTIVLPV